MCSLLPVPHRQRQPRQRRQPGLLPPVPVILPPGSASAPATGRSGQGCLAPGLWAGEEDLWGLSVKLRLSIPAAPRSGLAVPRLPPQSLFERGCCLRPYLYFNAASKPGAFTSQREGAREAGLRDGEINGGGGEGQPPSTPPPARRVAFCGGGTHGTVALALLLHSSYTPSLIPLVHIHQLGSPRVPLWGGSGPPSPRDEHRQVRGTSNPTAGRGYPSAPTERGQGAARRLQPMEEHAHTSTRLPSPHQPGISGGFSALRWLSISARAESRMAGSPQQCYVSHCGPSPSASVSLSNSPPFHEPLLVVRGMQWRWGCNGDGDAMGMGP